MALPPGYLAIVKACDELGIELDKEQAYSIEQHLKSNGWEIVASWQVDPLKRVTLGVNDFLPSITCPVCEMTSYNPNDIKYGYCGNCQGYTRFEATFR